MEEPQTYLFSDKQNVHLTAAVANIKHIWSPVVSAYSDIFMQE